MPFAAGRPRFDAVTSKRLSDVSLECLGRYHVNVTTAVVTFLYFGEPSTVERCCYLRINFQYRVEIGDSIIQSLKAEIY